MQIPLTISDFLDRAERVYPDRIGVIDEPDQPAESLGSFTYGDLAKRARAMAGAFGELGVPQGGRVAIVSHNAARFLTTLYGASAYGRICVPVNYRLNREEVQYIMTHSGASLALIDPELADDLADLDVPKQLTLGAASDEQLFRYDLEPEPWTTSENDTATINYTSGTTARPKGVQLTHRNLWLNATTFGWQAGVSDRDVYLHVLPMFHCNGWGMPFATAGMGAPQVVVRNVDGAEILRRVEEHGVTLICGAPAVLAAVLDAAESWDGPIPGAGKTRIITAGAPPPTRTIERVESELGWELIQIYGLTETSPFLTMSRSRQEWDHLDLPEKAKKLGRAGAPALGVTLDVDPEGEILARSNVIMDGYWDQPDETAKAMANDWFHTGDGGMIDDESHLHIQDRKKDVIISGGENVSSIEVEDCVFSHPEVNEVAVIGVPDEKWGETVKALVVVADGASVDEAGLIEHCRERLAHYKCPTSVEFRSELLRTATGKLQKYKLREPYWAEMDKQIN